MKSRIKTKVGLGLLMIMVGLILGICYVSAATPCILQLGDGDSVNAPGASSTSHLTCDGLKCTCHLSSGSGFCQVCTNGEGSYYFGNPSDCVSNCASSGGSGSNTELILTANFPFSDNGFFTKQTFFLDISTNKIASIYLVDNIAGTQVSLCPNCNSYKRSRNFKVGYNDITIRAVSGLNIKEKRIRFLIDNKLPRIIKTFPLQSKFIQQNQEFKVIYDEENVKTITFFYNSYVLGGTNITRSFPLSNCPSGKNVECSINVDLTEVDGRPISYWFVIEDIAGSIGRYRAVKDKVDLTAPKLIGDINYSIRGLIVKFNMTIEEINFYRVEYTDMSALTPRAKVLCSSLTKAGACVKQMSFARGHHDITLQISDKAGNAIGEGLSFDII